MVSVRSGGAGLRASLAQLALLVILIPANAAAEQPLDTEFNATQAEQFLELEEVVRGRDVPKLEVTWRWPSDLTDVSVGVFPRTVRCEVFAERGRTPIRRLTTAIDIRLMDGRRTVFEKRRKLRTGNSGQALFQIELAGKELGTVTHARGVARVRGGKRVDRIGFLCAVTLATPDLLPRSWSSVESMKTRVRGSFSRGSGFLTLRRAAAADDLPSLANTWGWPLAFLPEGSRREPRSMSCFLLLVRSNVGDVANVGVRYRVELERDGEVLMAEEGGLRSRPRTSVIRVPLTAPGLESTEQINLALDFRGRRKVAFVRFDCYTWVGDPFPFPTAAANAR